MRTKYLCASLAALFAVGALLGGDAAAQDRTSGQNRETRASQGDYAAYKLLRRAQDLLDAGEQDRGIKMLETVIEQHAKSPIRFQAYLALGKYLLEQRDYAGAVAALRNIEQVAGGGKREMSESQKEMYLEGLYLTGTAHFNLHQYGAAFSALRKITSNYPETVWANKAYYYIGMSHFAQSNWDKAIKALSQVGTIIDANSPTLAYAEAGHRLHIRITDGDLPVLKRLGREVVVTATTTSGDKETIVAGPMSSRSDVFVGSILTKPGAATPDDGTLQVIGGDSITVQYLDDNTKEGEKDVPRERVVDVVSTGGVTFTLGTYQSLAPAAYVGQPLFLKLWDLDLDKSEQKDTAEIRIATLYEPPEEEDELEADEPSETVDVTSILDEEEEEDGPILLVRDEVVLNLSERGELPLRSGAFLGSLPVKAAIDGQEADKTDQVLEAAVGDQIVATYIDELHVMGRSPVEVTATLTVAGEIDSAPRAAQNVVPDPLVKAKKQLVEAEAFLELAKIFKDMGLTDGAKSKAADGISRVEDIIRARAEIPRAIKEEAFRLKWELHLAEDEFSLAMQTCGTFNRLYPESPLVDRALMGMAAVLDERKDTEGAIKVWRQVTSLPNSHAAAEAQFNIAEATKRMSRTKDGAVREYMTCAQRYPSSPYAGKSLGEVVNYHIRSGAYDVAEDMLQQIFIDYQDEDFLDEMLRKWIVLAYETGDYNKAMAKYTQLISEYPGSDAAQMVEKKGYRKLIEAKLAKNNEDKNTDKEAE